MDALERHLTTQIDRSARFFWHRLRWRAVARHLPDGVPFRLLDVGAGAGLLATFLREDRPAADYCFIEPIESLRSHLRAVHGAGADLEGAARFDGVRYVTLLDVLEHQADDRAFLRHLVARMEPGATLLLTVPAFGWLWSQWDVALGHHRRYDKRSLLRCLDGLPLGVGEVSYLFPELVPAALLRTRLRDERTTAVDEEADFPRLPRAVNAALYGIGRASLAGRRLWPVGTSLLAVLPVQK